MHDSHTRPSCHRTGSSPADRTLCAWARHGAFLFAMVALFAMAHAVDWRWGMLLSDLLVWMVLLVAVAAGLVCGYALGLRVQERSRRAA